VKKKKKNKKKKKKKILKNIPKSSGLISNKNFTKWTKMTKAIGVGYAFSTNMV